MKSYTPYPTHAVAIYPNHEGAESAVKLLNTNGFDMKKLSIIGQDYETQERPIGFVNSGDRMLSWGKFGAFWGSIWGLLFGSAMLFVPGIGYLLFAGYIVAAIEGAAIGGGLAALAGALTSLGIPNDTVIEYESRIEAGSFILLIHGDETDTLNAKKLLEAHTETKLESFSTPEKAGAL